MTSPTRVVLCGGSNATHVLAADLGRRDEYDVRVLTSRPADWSTTISCQEHRSPITACPYLLPLRLETYKGRIARVFGWAQATEALADADIVVLACPVQAHRDVLARVLPALDPSRETMLGSLYAQGGFDWIVRELAAQFGTSMQRVSLFGLKRFPFLCKKKTYGQSVTLFGRFPGVYAAVQATDESLRQRTLQALGRIFDQPVHDLPGMLLCTLNLSNQVLHPAVTWSLFGGTNTPHTRIPRFYGECNRHAARLMRLLGLEIQAVARRLETIVDMPLVRWLPADPQARLTFRLWELTKSPAFVDRFLAAGIRNNRRINRALAPMLPAGDGFVPDFSSRFWGDDIPHGLCVVYGLAELVDEPVPEIQQMILGQQQLMGKSYLEADGRPWPAWGPDLPETNSPQRYGVTAASLASFLAD